MFYDQSESDPGQGSSPGGGEPGKGGVDSPGPTDTADFPETGDFSDSADFPDTADISGAECFLEGADFSGGAVLASSDSVPAGRASAAAGSEVRGHYDREVVQGVWEYAEVIPGVDPDLWRKDEFGDWIHRLDFGRRTSRFGWEIFDPGLGRRVQGVYAMRPMQWESYLRQYQVSL